MKLGTEDKKKTALAAALSVVALVVAYVQFFSGAPMGSGGSPRVAAPRPAAVSTQAVPARRAPSATRRRVQAGQGFEPVWERVTESEAFDPVESDPTLRTDLLAAVRSVSFDGVDRNIFEFAARRRPEPVISQAEQERAAELQRQAEQRAAAAREQGPAQPTTPRAPRLNWRYYGFANAEEDGEKRAFLLDGEQVLIGGVGDVFRDRYKIIRIELTQIVIEDMQFESEQQLPLESPRG